MGELFPNQYYGMDIWKHQELPLLETHDFSFYRCIQFQESFYGKTVSELHGGNLRESRRDNRYSNLFPGQKLSYWADSPMTARAEVKKWGANKNLLTFWAYDDGSSFIPTVSPKDYLKIVDGIHFGFETILKKVGNNERLTEEERSFVNKIKDEKPDCLAYSSEAIETGTCFLFFENGFKKLSLREVRLRLGEESGKNHAAIQCAGSSDYIPSLKSYGRFFLPKARIGYDTSYEHTEEYILRKQIQEESYKKIRGTINE